MKQNLIILNLVVVCAVALFGCAKKPTAANSSDAINQSQNLQTAEEKANYLVDQARGFITTKQYDEAMKTAQYVLSNVKQDSQEARNVLQKAADEMKANLQKSAAGMQDEVNKMLSK
jgi:hypothetical protein